MTSLEAVFSTGDVIDAFDLFLVRGFGTGEVPSPESDWSPCRSELLFLGSPGCRSELLFVGSRSGLWGFGGPTTFLGPSTFSSLVDTSFVESRFTIFFSELINLLPRG